MQGIIKKYIIGRGFGFIEDENKDSRFFHITDVTNPENIEINATVDFSPEKNNKGLIATSISIKEEQTNIDINLSNDKKKLVADIKKRVKSIRNYTPKVAVFGDTGVGKSSLCNALFGKKIAKISRVEACTREPKEILIGNKENGGIILIDVPGIAEDISRHKEYMELYESLLPEVDLVLWAIKADDRKYVSAIEVYEKILKPKKDEIPIIFVITQADKIGLYREWDVKLNKPSKSQKNDIIEKTNDISAKFNVSTRNIIAVSSDYPFNLVELVDKIVEVLPNEKKYSFVREAKKENVSNEAEIKAEEGIWKDIKEFAGEAWEEVKEVVVDVIVASATKVVKNIWGKLTSWW